MNPTILQNLTLISELMVAIVATLFFYKYKHLPVRIVLVILWLGLFADVGAGLYTKYVFPNNHWVYNLYAFLFLALFYKMIYDHVEDHRRRRVITIISTIMLGLFVFRAATTPVLTRFMEKTFTVGIIVLIINLLYYAIDQLKSDRNLKIKNKLEYFVFAGYLIFSLTFIPLSYFIFGQQGHRYSDNLYETFFTVQKISLLFMNGLLIFGFIWTAAGSVKPVE